jgi:hypothetical protein
MECLVSIPIGFKFGDAGRILDNPAAVPGLLFFQEVKTA